MGDAMNYQISSQNGIFNSISGLKAVKEQLNAHDIYQLPPEYQPPAGEGFIESVQRLSAERVQIYFDAIDMQGQLERAGLERIDMLRSAFNFYSNKILGGNLCSAKQDLFQQETDLAIMFSFSHSFTLHADAFGGGNLGESYSRIKGEVEKQYELYRRNVEIGRKKDEEAIQSVDDPITFTSREENEFLEKFTTTTEKVAGLNFGLADINRRLFENMAMSHFVWLRSLEENVTPLLGESLYPKSDLSYADQLLELALQRVEAFSWRGTLLFKLVDKCNSRYEDLWHNVASPQTP